MSVGYPCLIPFFLPLKYSFYELEGRSLPAEISHDRHEAQVRSSYRGLALVKVQTDQGMWVQKVRME